MSSREVTPHHAKAGMFMGAIAPSPKAAVTPTNNIALLFTKIHGSKAPS